MFVATWKQAPKIFTIPLQPGDLLRKDGSTEHCIKAGNSIITNIDSKNTIALLIDLYHVKR